MNRTNVDVVRNFLNSQLFERERLVDYSIAALLIRQHLFMIGPPGVAKSLLAENISKILDCKIFVRLFSKETKYNEVFGPVKISKLKSDIYEYNIDGFLPTANIFVGDEIWKGGVVLNSLLTILNERKFDNGNTRIDCPLYSGFFASNELPESSELNALYDRMLFRCEVDYIYSTDDFVSLMKSKLDSSRANANFPKVKIEDLWEEYRQAIPNLKISDDILQKYHRFIILLRQAGVTVSDRRAGAAIEGARALHFVKGKGINHNIFYEMVDMLWYKPEERNTIIKIITDPKNKLCEKSAIDTQNFIEALKKIEAAFKTETLAGIEANRNVASIVEQIKSAMEIAEANGEDTSIFEEAVRLANAIKRKILLKL